MKHLSFRELSALGSALILAWVGYEFLPYAIALAGSDSDHVRMFAEGGWRAIVKGDHLLHYVGVAVVSIIVLQIVYHTLIAILMRKEANAPMDERDRMVNMKAQRVAYYLLDIGAAALAAYVIWANVPGMLAAFWLITLLVAKEVVKYLAMFVYYRLSI